jgi:hypothetical protein
MGRGLLFAFFDERAVTPPLRQRDRDWLDVPAVREGTTSSVTEMIRGCPTTSFAAFVDRAA